MKCAVITGDKKIEIMEKPIPKVNKVPLVKVTHVGICGSDVHYWEEGSKFKGVVLGHEYTGIIEEDNSDSGLKKGDRVVGYTQNSFNEACGKCDACLKGNFDNCTNRTVKIALGCEIEHPGAYSEYVSWFPQGFFKIPDSVSNEEAALIEPAAVALHAVRLAEVQAGDKVVVFGGGIIGACVAEWVKVFGASNIIIIEKSKEKVAALEELKIASTVLCSDEENIKEKLMQLSNGGFDLFFDCVGISSTINLGLQTLKRGKTGIGVGVNFDLVPVSYYDIVVRQLRLQGSKGHVPEEFKMVLRALENKTINLEKYISKRIAFEDIQEAMESIKNDPRNFKVLIDMTIK